MRIRVLNDHFADSLGSAHYIGGIYCLVCRDQDHLMNLVTFCRLNGIQGTENIVHNRFVGHGLHKRNVLVSGGVNNDIGLFCGEEGLHGLLATKVQFRMGTGDDIGVSLAM